MKFSKNRPELNASSMADIAFLLLIFFLVTTTIQNETGIFTKLPPMVEAPNTLLHSRNVLDIKINANNKLLVKGDLMPIQELSSYTTSFLLNKEHRQDFPAFKKKTLNLVRTVPVSKQVISIQNDRGTSYNQYIQVRNEILKGYSAARNHLARKYFGTTVIQLENQDEIPKLKVIQQMLPHRISEAEPVEVAALK